MQRLILPALRPLAREAIDFYKGFPLMVGEPGRGPQRVMADLSQIGTGRDFRRLTLGRVLRTATAEFVMTGSMTGAARAQELGMQPAPTGARPVSLAGQAGTPVEAMETMLKLTMLQKAGFHFIPGGKPSRRDLIAWG